LLEVDDVKRTIVLELYDMFKHAIFMSWEVTVSGNVTICERKVDIRLIL